MRLSMIVSVLLLLGAAIAEPRPASAAGYRVEYAFNSANNSRSSTGGLLTFGDKLYGVTSGGSHSDCKRKGSCGTVFSFDPLSGIEVQLYAFTGGSDGFGPAAGLIEYGGKLYGTTLFGGSANCKPNGCGTVFSIDLNTGAETVVHTFMGGVDGNAPEAGLVRFGSKLYGTTTYGGSVELCSCGTVYSVDPMSGAEKVVYAFTGGDGAYPFSGLTKVGDLLYGTVGVGGSSYCNGNGCGTVFSLDPTTNAMALVYAFKGGDDGATPYGALLEVGNVLYGTTGAGGQSPRHACGAGCGVVFSLQPTTGAEAVVYAFQGGLDALSPRSDLISVNGVLYGTTEFGGARKRGNGGGTLYSIDPATGIESVVHTFKASAEGLYPDGALTRISHALYGTTIEGGGAKCGCGILYKLHP